MVTAFFEVVKAASNDTPPSVKAERSLALDTVVHIIVDAPRLLFDTFLLDLTPVVSRHALKALPTHIELLAVFVFRNTPSVRSEQVVRVTLYTFSVLGDQTIG